MSVPRLIGVFLRLGAMNELAYRSNFWIQTFETLLSFGSALAAIFLVYRHTDELAGWSVWDLMALIGVYYLMMGVVNLVVSPSLNRFIGDVRTGNLDFTITKPEDAQLLVSISEFQLWKVFDVVLGLGILVLSLIQLSQEVTPATALAFVFVLLCGAVVVYCFWLVLATLAFWFIRIDNILFIFWSVYVAGRWPISIYPSWLRWLLTGVVPIAFAVTVPASALTGRLEPPMLLAAALLALAAVVVSRAFWRLGLRHYSGASA